MSNVTQISSYLYNETSGTQSSQFSFVFGPSSKIPEGCKCNGNFTIGSFASTENVDLSRDRKNGGSFFASITGLGNFVAQQLDPSLPYDPRLALYEYFDSVNCTLALDYVSYDGSLWNPYPSVVLSGEPTFNRSYGQCYGDMSAFNESSKSTIAAVFGVKTFGNSPSDCILACTYSATPSYDSYTHTLKVQYGQNGSVLPTGCACSSTAPVYQQDESTWYSSATPYFSANLGGNYFYANSYLRNVNANGDFVYFSCFFASTNYTYSLAPTSGK